MAPMTQPATNPSCETNVAFFERRLAQLERLAELGIRLGEALERHVLALERAQDNTTAVDPTAVLIPFLDTVAVAASYRHISRAVRMTLALQARLERPPRPAAAFESSARPPSHRAAPSQAPGRIDVISDFADRLRESTEDLRDREKVEALVEDPVGEVLMRICRDLDFTPAQQAAVLARWAGDTPARSCPEAADIRSKHLARESPVATLDLSAGLPP
jgi:hypothetical protein